MQQLSVVKIGGNELDDPAFLERLCAAVKAFAHPLVLVHGGGKEITAALERYNQPSHFVEGLRVTPPESMAVMEMVACGSVSKRIAARLVASGVQALGLSGVDLGLLRCVPYTPGGVDLGRVGEIISVDTATIRVLLNQGWVPAFAPVALGANDGLPYNVNADHIAQAVAAAFSAEVTTELMFVSNVPGVMLNGHVVERMGAADIEREIASGTISGGMIPKVRSALAALGHGVAAVRITNLDGFAAGGTHIA